MFKHWYGTMLSIAILLFSEGDSSEIKALTREQD